VEVNTISTRAAPTLLLRNRLVDVHRLRIADAKDKPSELDGYKLRKHAK
jgi:hypothetical protein